MLFLQGPLLFLVMELMEGGSLMAALHNAGRSRRLRWQEGCAVHQQPVQKTASIRCISSIDLEEGCVFTRPSPCCQS